MSLRRVISFLTTRFTMSAGSRSARVSGHSAIIFKEAATDLLFCRQGII